MTGFLLFLFRLKSPIILKFFVELKNTGFWGLLKNQLSDASLLKYIKTKFLRLLLGTLKVTQDNKKAVWENIPLQDFTINSAINWSQSIPEIDQQLYKKYHLSEEEIAFVESMIKPMN